MESGPRSSNHVLISGKSGSGKTTLAEFFKKAGKNAYDADIVPGLGFWTDSSGKPRPQPTHEEWEQVKGFEWKYDSVKLKEILSQNNEIYLFGGSENIYDLAKLFDRLYYLYADEKLILERLEKRSKSGKSYHDFGRIEAQRKGIISNIGARAEQARKAGFVFIDASLSPQQILAIICKVKIK